MWNALKFNKEGQINFNRLASGSMLRHFGTRLPCILCNPDFTPPIQVQNRRRFPQRRPSQQSNENVEEDTENASIRISDLLESEGRDSSDTDLSMTSEEDIPPLETFLHIICECPHFMAGRNYADFNQSQQRDATHHSHREK